MISLDEARRLVSQAVTEAKAMERERVSLYDAVNRILAEAVISAVDLPVSDYSAMDGYALRLADLQTEDAVLPMLGECKTGHSSVELPAQGCLRIFTGAHIPEGADAVVMQENTTRTGNQILFLKRPQLGENIRRRGEDVRSGSLILERGTRLLPHQLGLLASAERTEVVVARRPRVGIVCTGDELRPFGSQFYGGQLAESNSIALATSCIAIGAEPFRSPLVSDDLESIKTTIAEACSAADVVITVGGVSVGDHDLVRPAIEALGGEVIFHKVAIKPGKPVLLAKCAGRLIFGLPGNPASAQVVFSLLGIPLIRALGGETPSVSLTRHAEITHDFSHRSGRRSFYRARLDGDRVTVLSNQASGASTSMAWANCLLEMGEEIAQYEQGARVPVLAFNDL